MIGRLQSTVVEDVFTPVIVDENDVVCMLDPRAHVYCEDLPLYSPKSSGLQWVQEYLRKEPSWLDPKKWNGPTTTWGEIRRSAIPGSKS